MWYSSYGTININVSDGNIVTIFRAEVNKFMKFAGYVGYVGLTDRG
jgi:hypothetical protein